jgi:penicillin-binding protein activator
MKMTTKVCCSLSVLLAVFVTGCATKAHYVDAEGTRTMVNVGKINIQDFGQAAETMVNSLLASGHLDKVTEPPAILVISRIVNNTSQQVDTDLLTKKIRVALNQSGKAVTRVTRGVGGTAEDELARELEAEEKAKGLQTRTADFSLSGKIIETTTRAGDLKQSAFTFQLSLTDTRGLAVWEDEKAIVKQGSRATVGF